MGMEPDGAKLKKRRDGTGREHSRTEDGTGTGWDGRGSVRTGTGWCGGAELKGREQDGTERDRTEQD